MTAIAGFVSEYPSLFVVSIQEDTITHHLIEETCRIVLNIASTEQLKLAKKPGHKKVADKSRSSE